MRDEGGVAGFSVGPAPNVPTITKPGASAGFHIVGLVANNDRPPQIQVQQIARTQQHARIGLARRMVAYRQNACAARMVPTGEHKIDLAFLRFQKLQDPAVDRRKIRPAEIAARYARLVGDDDRRKPNYIGSSDDGQHFRPQHDIGRIARIAGVDIDGAVAVEEQRRQSGWKGSASDPLDPQAWLDQRTGCTALSHC
ncbi:hypothetical protein ABID25_000266 [Mesorhizobium abyssinicae]